MARKGKYSRASDDTEQDIIKMFQSGVDNKTIADMLGVSLTQVALACMLRLWHGDGEDRSNDRKRIESLKAKGKM